MKIRKVLEISAVAIVGLMASACVADLGKSTADRMLNDTSSSTSTATTGTNSVGRATSIASSSASTADTDKFTTIEDANNGNITVICDNTTGVEYIAFTSPVNGAIAVTPRLNRDRTLVIKK